MKIAPVLLAVAVAVTVPQAQTKPADWPQFRGPNGDGVTATAVPVSWAEGKNIKWKVPIHGRGWSSPIILGNRIWLTTATPNGKELSVLALDRDSGQVIHDIKLFEVETPQFIHAFNSPASPTPVAEPGMVCVTFGSPGTACLDPQTAKVIWQRRDLECNHFRGAGSSPIFFRDLIIMHYDGSDVQYVVALEKRTGKTVWKTTRSIDFQDLDRNGKPMADGDLRKAYATPHIITVNGQPMLISLGAKAAYGYNPLTGEELWRLEERTSHSTSSRPLFANGMVYYTTGWATGQVLAIRPDGRGDVTNSHVVWRVTRGASRKPSLIMVDDLIYVINDGGILNAIDAKTGEIVWTNRIGNAFSASPVAAAGRVYFFDEEGQTTVIQAGREYKVLATNALDDGVMASPAIAGNAMFLRTKTHLYRIEE
jgi:outer membrane protein assembly factor BamB